MSKNFVNHLLANQRLPRGLIASSFLLALGALGCSSPTSPTTGAQTVFVSPSGNDSTAGTIGAPWRTLKYALAQLHAGDTLYVRQGTYEEGLQEEEFRASGSSWASPITIAAQPGEVVTLKPVTGAGGVAGFVDGAISYVVLDHLILDGLTSGGGAGGNVFYLGASSHHIRLTNVEIVNGDGNGVLGAGRNHEFLNLQVHNNGLYPGYTNSNGMYLTTTDSVIDGGSFYNNEGYGVRFLDSDPAGSSNNNIVRKAQIFNNGYGVGLNGLSISSSGGGGIVLGDVNNRAEDNVVYGNFEGIVVFGFKRSSGTRIANNDVHDSVGVGIEVQSGAVNAQIVNNRVWGSGTADIIDGGTNTTTLGNTFQ